jgi:hypothetical protein
LADRAFNSLTKQPTGDEPQKTPMAVGFQLTEIVAALQRCRSAVTDSDLQQCFDPVIARCRELLNTLVAQQTDLRTVAFMNYTTQILGTAQ